MSDDTGNNDDFGALTGDDEEDEGGFGNLPPLSDFDSGDGESDGGLPPLDSDPGDEDSDGGLPPIVDIKVDTPAVRPSDLDTPDQQAPIGTPGGGFDTPTNDLDTPEPGGGLGFQDFAADSDFSPETPEIGPGPDSDIETPMFDSAFGGNSDDFSSGGAGTPSPTQAMETPMFDGGDSGFGASNFGGDSSGGGGAGFDNDAFGAPTPDIGAEGATPIPDFSPDTGMPQDIGQVAGAPKKKGKGGSKVKTLVVVILVLVAIGGALIGGPHISQIPNPSREELADANSEIDRQRREIQELNNDLKRENPLTEAQLETMRQQYDQLSASITTSEEKLFSTQDTLRQEDLRLREVLADIEIANDDFITASELLEELMNETTIVNSRHEGLNAENERLTDMVGELEEANERRQATLDTLIHNTDLLTVQIQGGSPLAPEKYNHSTRLTRVQDLHAKVSRAKWVTPQLMNEYTDLYLAELGIASSREYFFAKIPIHDSLDNKQYLWAECLMNGNWSVYYRTLNAEHVGSYENTSATGAPDYAFRENLPGEVQSDIARQITAARVEGYLDKFAILQGKDAIHDNESNLQKKFSSLWK